jgi:hypothetical protein
MADKKNTGDLRRHFDHPPGFDPEAIGVPEWTIASPSSLCPNCGARLCRVTCRVRQPMLRGGQGTCTYLGCPACPYAGPSLNVADG